MKNYLRTSLLTAVLAWLTTCQAAAWGQVTLTGPATAAVGQSVDLELTGLPAIDFDRPLNESLGWTSQIKIVADAPAGCTCQIASDLRLDFLNQSWRMVVSIRPSAPGILVVAADWNGDKPSLSLHRVTVGGVMPAPPVIPDPTPGPGPTPTPGPVQTKSVMYVYEKSLHRIPPQVAAALNKINRSGVLASFAEQDIVDGNGQVPTQYKSALEAAKAAGLPCLVVRSGDVVLKVVKAPQTEAEVMEALK